MKLRKQPIKRNLLKLGIRQVPVTIRKHQLHRLCHKVDRRAPPKAHIADVPQRQNIQELDQM